MKASVSYKKQLLQSLKDPEEAAAYLNAALEDKDPRVFLLALQDVIESRSLSIAQIAKTTLLDRTHLYRMLSKKGNPELRSLHTLLKGLGFRLAVAVD